MERQLETIGGTATSLSVSRAMVYRLIARGELKTMKIGRATRVTTDSIRQYVQRQLEAGDRQPAA